MIIGLREELSKAHQAAQAENRQKQGALDELSETKMMLDSKNKMCETIKGQVDNLVAELEIMRQNVTKKEKQ